MKIRLCYPYYRKYAKYLKNILCFALLGTMLSVSSLSFAETINKVSQETLQNIKGVGKNKAQKIIAERQRGGNFQNATDLRQRVKGVGEKTILKMEQAGITFTNELPPPSVEDAATVPSKPERKIRSRSRSQ